MIRFAQRMRPETPRLKSYKALLRFCELEEWMEDFYGNSVYVSPEKIVWKGLYTNELRENTEEEFLDLIAAMIAGLIKDMHRRLGEQGQIRSIRILNAIEQANAEV